MSPADLPRWDEETLTLSGTSSVIGGEPYRITLALIGYTTDRADADGARIDIVTREENEPLADLVIGTDENRDVPWEAVFRRNAADSGANGGR